MDFNNSSGNNANSPLLASLESQGTSSSSGDAAAWSRLIASLARNQQHQPPLPVQNEVAVLQALLTAAGATGQQQALQPMDIAGPSSNAAALLLASQLNSAPAGGSDHGTAAETAALTIPRAHSLPMGLTTARPRKSKKFRYSAALKQIRQAEAEGNPIRVDKSTSSATTLSTEQHRSLVVMGAVEAAPATYSCGDARCQQQIESLQMQLAYCKLEVDILREALRTLIEGRSREGGPNTANHGEQPASSKERSAPMSASIVAHSAPAAVAAAAGVGGHTSGEEMGHEMVSEMVPERTTDEGGNGEN